MDLDISTLWTFAMAVATPVLTYFAASLAKAVEARLKIQSGSASADDLDQALAHGVDILVDALNSVASHNGKIEIPAGALSNAVNLVLTLAPAAVGSLGITESQIESILTAKINSTIASAMPSTLLPSASASA